MTAYRRFVALGDSQTEGLGDPDGSGGLRGWADRTAEALARSNPGLRYANLAVRGRLAAQVRDEQLGAALALRPDLASVIAGVNDLMRPGFRADAVAGCLEEMYAALTATGARVVTATFPDVGRLVPAVKRFVQPRVLELNECIVAAAGRQGVTVVDTYPHPFIADRRMWAPDRLHLSPAGHARLAAAVLHALAVPGHDGSWTVPLPAEPPRSMVRAARDELRWAGTFAGPWLVRRLRGRSSGDGRVAKRSTLTDV